MYNILAIKHGTNVIHIDITHWKPLLCFFSIFFCINRMKEIVLWKKYTMQFWQIYTFCRVLGTIWLFLENARQRVQNINFAVMCNSKTNTSNFIYCTLSYICVYKILEKLSQKVVLQSRFMQNFWNTQVFSSTEWNHTKFYTRDTKFKKNYWIEWTCVHVAHQWALICCFFSNFCESQISRYIVRIYTKISEQVTYY